MRNLKFKSGLALLTVFAAILFVNMVQTPVSLTDSIHERVAIHNNDFSGEETETIFRTSSEGIGFETRTSHDIQITGIGDFHSVLTRTVYNQIVSGALLQREPIEVYKLTKRFLI